MAYNAQDLNLDYFTFYDSADQPAGFVIGVQGQFDKQPEKVQLTRLNAFANPASKNGEPIYDKNAHLTWYDMYDPVPDPMRRVAYTNQFGKGELITGRSRAFLSPTWKLEPGSSFPETLDHYRVYDVLQAEPVNTEEKVEDQFGAQPTRIYIPRFFAVPCKKWWEGQTFGIHNPDAHLVIYQVYPVGREENIRTRDQFSARIQNVFRLVLLGAPSKKTAWEEFD